MRRGGSSGCSVIDCGKWCLTPRSSRAPTACHAGPVCGTLYIFAVRARASHRWCRLNSNVRHQKHGHALLQQEVRLSAWIKQPRSGQAAGLTRRQELAPRHKRDGWNTIKQPDSCAGPELVSLPSSIVSAARAAALAGETMSVSQFFGPTAVGSIATSLGFRRGGRQVTGSQCLVSAERGASSPSHQSQPLWWHTKRLLVTSRTDA